MPGGAKFDQNYKNLPIILLKIKLIINYEGVNGANYTF